MVSTTKSIRYAGAYTSTTFNEAHDKLVGLNGVVSGGSVTTVGVVAYVQPLTFIQNGLMVTTDYVANSTVPSSLTAPYSIGFTVSSSVENPSEVLAPIFVKRPQDVSANTVLIADWDGYEWIPRPKVQIKEQILADQIRSVKQEFSGIADGFDVSVAAGNTIVTDGSLIDRQGKIMTKTEPTVLANVDPDIDGYGRIDTVLYRRPDDSESRSGVISQVVGRIFNSGSTIDFINDAQIGDNTKLNSLTKVINDPTTNDYYFFYIEDVGDRTKLRLRVAQDNGSFTGAHVEIAANLSSYDVVLNPDGSLDLTYVRGTNLYYKRVTTAGVDVYAESQIASHAVPLSNPKIIDIKSDGSYFLHIVYEVVSTVADHRLYYVRRSAYNTTETPSILLVNLSAIVTNPSIAKDDDDAILYLAFENFTTHRLYLRSFDASTATYSSAPAQLGASIELQDDTYWISGAVTLSSTGAYNPIVKRSSTKETFVFWRHDKGAGVYGIATYCSRYLATFGHKALVQDFIVNTENIGTYDVSIDGMKGAHFVYDYNAEVNRASLDLITVENIVPAVAIDSTASPTSSSITFSAKGAVMVGYTFANTGYSNNGATRDILWLGSGLFGGAVPINSNEFVVYRYDDHLPALGYDTLPTVPTVGDRIAISGTSFNDGNYFYESVRYFNEAGSDYAVVSTDVSPGFVNEIIGSAQFEVPAGSDVWSGKTTAGAYTNLRSFLVPETDIFIAHRRTTDDVLSVSGTSLEETSTVRRLYEFFNTFAGGGGTISWSKVGANKLALSSDLTIRVINRTATYTVAATPAGVTIAANRIAYITLPDEDSDATLALNVVSFGSGILDRHGRNTFPLFWNMGGYLYMRFSPFRLESSGETIQIGAQISQELIDWLGCLTENPDASNHGYSSVAGCGLLQSDSPIAAIGKIDATVLGLSGSLSKINAYSEALPLGSITKKHTFAVAKATDTYLVVPGMVNQLDTFPQFQPITVTKKETDGVTFSWNNPTDTANYSIEFFTKEP